MSISLSFDTDRDEVASSGFYCFITSVSGGPCNSLLMMSFFSSPLTLFSYRSGQLHSVISNRRTSSDRCCPGNLLRRWIHRKASNSKGVEAMEGTRTIIFPTWVCQVRKVSHDVHSDKLGLNLDSQKGILCHAKDSRIVCWHETQVWANDSILWSESRQIPCLGFDSLPSQGSRRRRREIHRRTKWRDFQGDNFRCCSLYDYWGKGFAGKHFLFARHTTSLSLSFIR